MITGTLIIGISSIPDRKTVLAWFLQLVSPESEHFLPPPKKYKLFILCLKLARWMFRKCLVIHELCSPLKGKCRLGVEILKCLPHFMCIFYKNACYVNGSSFSANTEPYLNSDEF